MIKYGFTLLAMAAISLSANSTPKDSTWKTDWETFDSVDSIDIACKTHRSDIDICRYTTITPLSVDALLAVNIDIPNLPKWMENILTSAFIETTNAFDYKVYTTYDFPGARNRDSVTHSTIQIDPHSGAATLSFETTKSDKKPEDLNFVRFPLIKGAWKFIPQTDGQTKVLYATMALPGGYVQKYLSDIYNYTSRGSGAKTVANLLEFARKPEYRSVKISSVHP